MSLSPVPQVEDGNTGFGETKEKLKLACSVGGELKMEEAPSILNTVCVLGLLVFCSNSKTAFQAIRLESYRNEISVSLLQMIRLCTRISRDRSDGDVGDDLDHYDASRIRNCLGVIEWKVLCVKHDEQAFRSTKNQLTQTLAPVSPLEEVVHAITNPTIIPRCCAVAVNHALIVAFLQSPRARARSLENAFSRWSPSQSTLLKSIRRLCAECPSAGLRSMQLFLLPFDGAVASQWNRLVSLANNLARDIPRAHFGLATFVADMVRRIDDLDVSSLLVKGPDIVTVRSDFARSVCLRCHGTPVSAHSLHPRKRTKRATLANLHDEDLTVSQAGRSQGGYWSRVQCQEVSLDPRPREKPIVQRNNSTCECHLESANLYSTLPPEWRLVRSRALKKFISIFEHCDEVTRVPLPSPRSSRQLSYGPRLRRFDIYAVLQLAHAYRGSPCARVCLLTCLDRAGGKSSCQHIAVVKTCLARYFRSKDQLWLRIYSELLVECPVFDKREHCWDVFLPVLEHLTTHYEEALEIELGLFRCVAFVLSRRYRLFFAIDDEIRSRFAEYKSLLKIRFGESRYWIGGGELRFAERQRTCAALERAGILSFVDLAQGTRECEITNEDGRPNRKRDQPEQNQGLADLSTESAEWPFPSHLDLRTASIRIGSDSCKVRLSSPDHDMEIVNDEKQRESGSMRDDSAGLQILNALDTDVFRLIFSYFGCKRLVKLRQVCSLWRTIVDESNFLWYHVWRGHFGFLAQDPRHTWRPDEDWRTLFVSKWLTKRGIAHQRNHTSGFKHMVCGYVGCLRVLKSRSAQERHYEAHARQCRPGPAAPDSAAKLAPTDRRKNCRIEP